MFYNNVFSPLTHLSIYLSVSMIFSLFSSPSFASSIVLSPAPSQITPPVIWSTHTHTTTPTTHVYVYLLASEPPAN